jgi:PAS domain S-box-containing protein
MKHIAFLSTNKKEYKKALEESKSKKYKSIFIQIFTADTKKSKIQKLLTRINNDFPTAQIIGTTTAGEINHAKMHDNTTSISISLFKDTKLKSTYVESVDNISGKELSLNICKKHTKAAVILSEGLLGDDYEGFIQGIKSKNEQLIIAGGLAGDNFELKKTYVFLNNKIYDKGAVAVSFSSKNLYANNKYNLNWTPIGQEFIITKSNGTIVEEINNETATSLFEKYLGKSVFENNAKALPDFQFLYNEGNTIVSRTPLAVDGTSLVFAAPLKQGQKVQFGFANSSSVISGAKDIHKSISSNPAEAIYIYSCIARKTLLGKVLENEFNQFEAIAPTAGFFTYGEFYSTTNNNALLNCTTTMLILSESKNKNKKIKKIKNIDDNKLDSITHNALTHFIKQTSKELDINVKLLNQYKDVVDEASLVSKTNIKGIITYVNDNFCKVSKYTKEELIGKNHNIVRDDNVSKHTFKKMWNTISAGKVWKGIFSNKAKDGTIYYVDATISPTFNEKNEIEEFIAIRQDITKQIQSKQRIKDKEKLINAVFDNQDSIVIYASKVKGMMNVNKKLFEILPYSNFEEFKRKNKCVCDNFIKEEGYIDPITYPTWMDDIADDSTNDYKVKMKVRDGSIHIFNIKIKRIDNEYIINLSDITNLENALLKAYSSEEAKSRFLSNMSHEIRTPLNGILGFTDILMKKDLDKDSNRYVDIIHKSGKTLLSVVNDILDFSKMESGQLELYKVDENLFEELESTVATFASVSKTKKINYFTFIDPNIPKILTCDTQRLKQVINNLISNAIKFTPQDGEVLINITLENIINNNAKIKFSVKDSGIGIDEDKQSSVFSAFSQADNSISREFGGTGLGLAISNKYINMMGSTIELNSKKGIGSEFYFSLELPIVNNDRALLSSFDITKLNIKMLNSVESNPVKCSINKVVATYLDAWKCNYSEINTLSNIDNNTDIVIVCAKIFNQEDCSKLLEDNPKLQLLYIEGYEDKFSCSNNRFHFLEQPLTGSLIFDKIVTFAMNKTNTTNSIEITTDDISNNFKGNILIAEDNETNQILISIMLDERGLDYKIVNNGQEAIDEIKTGTHYDIIFMDINMPILDGLSAIKILREDNYKKPIVSLSANVIESDIKSYIEAGVNDTLNKPLIPDELDNILEKYIK